MSVDRLPPHSVEAEQGVLGCLLLNPAEVLPQCIEKFVAGAEVFYDLRHRAIYNAALEMWDKDTPIDLITLQQHLRDNQQLEGIGGLSYLAGLPDAVPSAANIDYYADILTKKFMLRRLVAACAEISSDAYSEQGDAEGIVTAAASAMDRVADLTINESGVATMRQLVPVAMDYIENLHLHAGQVTGLATGLPDLDVMTWGLQPSEMVVLAARPSMGKTALGLNIAVHVATQLQLPVAVFSMEMSKESLMVRTLCSLAHVSNTNIRRGFLSERDFQRLSSAGQTLHRSPMFIDDTSALGILQLRARARRLHKQHGIRLVVIDYLQLMTAPTKRSDNRQQEVSYISGGCKALAKELKIPVLVLAQLSRKLEDRGANPVPKISDLRESGSIEQDADVILLLHKPQKDIATPDGTYDDAANITAIVAKNRCGPTGEVPLLFLRSWTKFESVARVSSEDVQQDPQLL